MSVTLKYVLFLFWLCYLIVCALLLFTRGFLLNRNVLPNQSTCEENILDCGNELNSDLFSSESKVNSLFSSKYCLKNNNLKAIVILIDALRYDFVQFQNYSLNDNLLPYHNKLKVIINAAESSKGFLYKFIADPPTTTLQRINGLTTGSLPTFIDISSNFASGEINEDNIIDQLVSNKKKIIFMGDDTWVNIFPNRFYRQYPFPSFNVWDLDTVDRGVEDHLVPEMKKKDWQVIIAHFLGIDHCGHRYGPLHPEMIRKLDEMNSVLSSVMDELDKDTVLFVIGDHGMTDNGDHGGDSEEEITSALFIFSKDPVVRSRFTRINEIQQIDFVPTFSQLMGVPIPFSNLGSTMLSSFALQRNSVSNNSTSKLNCAALSMWNNIQQITEYITHYSKIKEEFAQSSLQDLSYQYDKLISQLKNLNSDEAIKSFLNDATDYLRMVREMCRNIWVQFDTFSMTRGLVSMFVIISLLFILIDGLPGNVFQELIISNFIGFCFCGTFFSYLISAILYYYSVVSSLELTIYFSTCIGSIIILAFIIIWNWSSIADNWYKSSKSKEPLNIISRLIMLIGSCALLSNSYIVEENIVVPFLLITMIWMCVFDPKLDVTKKIVAGKHIDTTNNKLSFHSVHTRVIILTIVLNIFIRLSFYYWQCREEQAKYCSLERKASKTLLCVLSILSFAVFIAIVRMSLRNIGNLVGWSPPIFIARYFPSLGVVCCGCYWLLNSLPHKIKPKLFLPWQLQLFPQIVFIISFLAIVVLYIYPLCIYATLKQQSQQSNTIPTLFNKLKNIMIPGQSNEYPMVYGLASVYSATFINISVFLSLLSAILLGETLAAVTVIMVASMYMISAITAIINLEKQKHKDYVLTVPWWSIMCWCLSSSHFFYATGHQASFPSIHWNSAGLFGDIISTFLAGILVTLNTFVSQITHALLLPILLITPFTLMVVWPKLMPSDEFKKGELFLYENEELRRQEMFSLILKYILLQAFRVFMCMFSACIHSRHLMVWKIFAPKLIFEGIGFLVSLPFLFLGYCLIDRISFKIFNLMEKLNHSS